MFTRNDARRGETGRRLSSTARGAVIGAVVSAVVLGSASAFAGSGIGATFHLGKVNSVNATTTLTGTAKGRMLSVINKGTGPGLGVTVGAGNAPIAVNPEAGKALNLDADELDGLDSSAFLGAGAKAADADLLDGRDSGDFAAAGHDHDDVYVKSAEHTKAAHDGLELDADTLDGRHASEFLAATGKAADADRLDGLDSSQFVRGPGAVVRGAVAIPPTLGVWVSVLTTTAPSFTVGYRCPSDLSTNGVYVFVNGGNEALNVFVDNGGPAPMFQQLAANGGRWDTYGAAAGEHFSVQVQGSTMATYELFSVHRSGDCHVQAMAVQSN